jgi:hypothetical protein
MLAFVHAPVDRVEDERVAVDAETQDFYDWDIYDRDFYDWDSYDWDLDSRVPALVGCVRGLAGHRPEDRLWKKSKLRQAPARAHQL